MEKNEGGLGLRSLSKLNKALLSKWSWRFANERDSLWRLVISSKFCVASGGWSMGDIRGGYGTGLWKEIRKEWPLFFQNATFSVGHDRRISFWKDIWCEEELLSSTFPTLFSLAVLKGDRIADVWDNSRGGGGWSPIFSRSIND